MESPARPRDEPRVACPPPWGVRVAGALCLGWIVLAWAGPILELSPGVRAWNPPAALLAAAVLLWGARALVPIILAASALAVWAPTTSPSGVAPWRALLVSVAVTVIYWLCARPLRARPFDLSFGKPVDVARFGAAFVAAAALAAVVGAVESEGFAALVRPRGLLVLRTLWVGDVVAVIALAPAMIVAICWLAAGTLASAVDALRRARPLSLRVILQVASIPLALATTRALSPSLGFFAYALCFLPLGWIAVAHGTRTAAITNLALTIGVVWMVHGPTAGAPGRLELQAFVGLLALTGLLVGSVAGERERAFALLAESEERYRKLVEFMPDPLLVHADGRVLFANGAAASVLGATSATRLTGLLLVDMAAPSSRGLLYEPALALRDGGGNVPLVHHTMKRLDGSGLVDLESVSIPLSFQGRDATLTVARDVTARVRLEEELRHAQRMEAVGRLAGGVAHDFNNLLTVIVSYSELLISELGQDERLLGDVQEIRHAADRAAVLTRQLLSFSRRQVLRPAPLDLNDVVRGTEGLLRRLIGPEITVVARFDPSAGMVFADEGQLEQVIVNLVVNARDAMPGGGVLTVETQLVPVAETPLATLAAGKAERYAALVVRDTGAGMDDATVRRIFDPFFTTKELGRGTGLGLSTVHGIVEQSGGTVTVESRIGEGSEFRVLLPSFGHDPESAVPPRVVQPVPPRVLQPAQSRRVLGRSSLREPTRVLLVEDDDAVRLGLRRMLDAAGYDVVEAADGEAALAAVEGTLNGVSVVLSDVAMPTLDGRELARAIRARQPALPFILMSGFADRAALEEEVPGIVVLQKPLAPDALVTAIETAVSRLPQLHSPAPPAE